MPRRKSRKSRPFEIVMDEAGGEAFPWDLGEHLNGCLVAYQTQRTFGAAVALALEALRGIARDVDIRANAGCFSPHQLDDEWILSPRETIPVPWIWIRALSTAWEKYNSEGGPLGRAFGLEGGQGKPPTITKLMQMLDQRAIARWVWWRVETLRAAGQEISIEDVIQEAAEKFGKHDITIRRAWGKFGGLEKPQNMTSRK
jgi:hypothetical protein